MGDVSRESSLLKQHSSQPMLLTAKQSTGSHLLASSNQNPKRSKVEAGLEQHNPCSFVSSQNGGKPPLIETV